MESCDCQPNSGDGLSILRAANSISPETDINKNTPFESNSQPLSDQKGVYL